MQSRFGACADGEATPFRSFEMMALGMSLMACAVFVALAAVAVTAALKSARIDNVIGEVFSPWIEDPFEQRDTASATKGLPDAPAGTAPEKGQPVAARS